MAFSVSLVAARLRLASLLLVVAASSCATEPAPAPAAPQPAPPNPALQPPAFTSPPVASPAAREDQRTRERREITEAAWRTVREKHYDPKLGGVDWDAMLKKYEPRALAAPDDATFYRTLNDMLGELGQSHMMITGPGAGDGGPQDEAQQEPSPQRAPADTTGPEDVGDPGVLVRVIDGRPTVTSVRAGSSADKHGIKPGFLVTAIGGRPVTAMAFSRRSLRPVEERFAVRRAALRRLEGPVGSKVTFAYQDNADRPGQVILDRDPPPGPLRQVGYLPPLHPELRAYEVNGVGVLAFNIFLLDPLLGDIKHAMDRFEAEKAKGAIKGLILDLRGNPGGLAAMAIPVAAELVTSPISLGSMLMRDNTRTDTVATFSQTFAVQPAPGRKPYGGPLMILTDEGTASASEILAAGLQEAGRARVVGDTSLGAVLPSVVESLPHGAVMQVVVADFKTPKGVLLEGRGVQPDQRVLETRAAFASGHDPVLDAAVDALRGAPLVPASPRNASRGTSTDAKAKARSAKP